MNGAGPSLRAAAAALGAVLFAYGAAGRLRAAAPRPTPLEAARGSADYLSLGRRALFERRYAIDGDAEPATAHRAPLYPALVAAALAAGGEDGTAVLSRTQSLLAAAAAAAVLGLGWTAGGPWAGAAAALAYWTAPELAQGARALNVEPLYALCLLAAACALAAWARRPDARRAGLLGAAVGVGLSCRSPLAVLPVLAAFPVWKAAGGGKKGRRALAALFLGAALPLGPWVLRNAAALGRFVPLEDAAAGEALYGASLGLLEFPAAEGQVYAAADAQRPGWRSASRARGFAELMTLARENIASDPLGYAAGCARRLGLALSYRLRLLGADVPYGVLLAAALAGAAVGADGALAALAGFCLLFFGLHSAVLATQRYYEPVAPVLLAAAAAGAAAVGRRALGARAVPAPRPALLACAGLLAVLAPLHAAASALLLRERLGAGWPALDQARAARAAGAPAAAVDAARRAQAQAPSQPGPRLELGAALLDLGRAREAEAELSEAARLSERLAYPWTLGEALGRRAQARLAAGLPGWREDLAGSFSWRGGRVPQDELEEVERRGGSAAEAWLAEAARLSPPGAGRAFLLLRRARLLSARGSGRAAAAAVARARAEEPEHACGSGLESLAGLPGAGEVARACLALGPTPAAWLARAREAAARGRPADERAALARALALDASYAPALAWRSGRAAAAPASPAPAAAPPSAPAAARADADALRSAREQEARLADDRALAGGDWDFLGARCAQALERRGLAAASIEDLQACARRRPADARLLADLGVALARAGRTEQARRELRRALELDSGLAEAHLSLAALEPRESAREHLSAAVLAARARGKAELAAAAERALSELGPGERP